jgi:hypothetical protein
MGFWTLCIVGISKKLEYIMFQKLDQSLPLGEVREQTPTLWESLRKR